MIVLEDKSTWPKLGSTWMHRNGNKYSVEMFANDENDRQVEYPTMIIYRNNFNMKVYARKLVDWDRSMLHISDD